MRNLWPLEEVLFALADSMTLRSLALSFLVNPWFPLLAAFVGVSRWLFVGVAGYSASLVRSREVTAEGTRSRLSELRAAR